MRQIGRKRRKPENIRFIVKWVDGDMMRFRAYKRDFAACEFAEFLTYTLGVPPEDIRIIQVR